MADLATIAEIKKSEHTKAILQAVLATIVSGGTLTQKEIAKQLGVSPQTVGRWIKGSPKRGWKGPFVHVMEAVSGHHGEGKFTGRCAHKPGYPKPGRPAICLVCLASNVEGLLSKMRRNGDDAIDVPDSVYAGKAKYKFKPKGKA